MQIWGGEDVHTQRNKVGMKRMHAKTKTKGETGRTMYTSAKRDTKTKHETKTATHVTTAK
jgi:hypothetical protein